MKNKENLNELSFSELKDKVEELDKIKEKVTKKKEGVWIIGENYFIRTVTMALLGKLINVTEKELVLENASWIADTGRFHQFIKEGKLDNSSEVEPFVDDVIVNRSALIDATVWKHKLLETQK